eukprot:GFUD01004334.1.p1 GENE.GFUD01004334.1~~GFUD01004334.1.p1  ORF type:complete len:193 (+),score=39.05 GFUD01004334.1:50-628(+)
MSGIVKKCFSWLQSQSDLTQTSVAAAATAAVLPGIPLLPPAALATLNLASLSVQLGTQVYESFVGGPTMLVNLPRVPFGDIRARLFPKMGMLYMFTGALALASYTVNHPVDTATYLLATSLIINLLNSFIIFPKVTQFMLELRQQKEGTMERKKAAKKFGITHGVSIMIILGSTLANISYLYIISSRIVGHW